MRRSTLLCLAILLAPMAAHADDGDSPAVPSFADVDTNNDLYIEAAELRAFLQQMREQAGQEGREGRRPPFGRGGRPGSPMEMADVDGDGMLNEQEYYDFLIRIEEARERFRERTRDGSEDQ